MHLATTIKMIIIVLIIVLLVSSLYWYNEYLSLKQKVEKGVNEAALTLSYILADLGRYLRNLTNDTIREYGYIGVLMHRSIPLAQSLYYLTGKDAYIALRDCLVELSQYFDKVYLKESINEQLRDKIARILNDLSLSLRSNDTYSLKENAKELLSLIPG